MVYLKRMLHFDKSTQSPDGLNKHKLASLRAEFDEKEHGEYVKRLAMSLRNHQDWNIAVTGSYGAGKSSVLAGLEKIPDYKRIARSPITLSLSTLSGDAARHHVLDEDGKPVAPGRADAVLDTTNLIQKEIVKQLIYRQRPAAMRNSRYRRISRFQGWKTLGLCSLGVALALGVAYLFGLSPQLDGWPLGTLLWYIAILVPVSLLTTGGAYLLHDRADVGEVSAAGASLTLSPRAESYFDEYLDEIVYFFEKTRCDLVIVEDLDRFEDPYIFETLRELNTILNNSRQIRQKPVRFVYAIRDSIFESIGDAESKGDMSRVLRPDELARTNRTKFFDLVIPIVPFVTHENARDLLHAELASRKSLTKREIEIDPDLVELVARHVPDMRLMRNIVNEFEVFLPVVIPPQPTDGASAKTPRLDPNKLFAMVTFKNFHLADYEKVIVGRSKLDSIYDDYRQLVNTCLVVRDRIISAPEREKERQKRRAHQATALGERLQAISRVTHFRYANEYVAAIVIENSSYDIAKVTEPRFWDTLLSTEEKSLEVSTTANARYPCDRHALASAVGLDLADDLWTASDRSAQQAAVDRAHIDREFLRNPTMKAIYQRPEFTANSGMNFAQLVAAHGASDLVTELIREGWIDEYYTLYVSRFHGAYMSAEAKNYEMQTVREKGYDPSYPFAEASDIEALLSATKRFIFEERAIFNVDIFDYLLQRNDERISVSFVGLVQQAQGPDEFLKVYIARGTQTRELFRRLAQKWPGVFRYISINQELSVEQSRSFMDGALVGASTHIDYATDSLIREYIEANALALPVLTSDADPEVASRAANVMIDLGVKLPVLRGLNERVTKVLVASNGYRITEDNLRIATGTEGSLTLDAIRNSQPASYDYVREHADLYMDVIEPLDSTKFSIESAEEFEKIVSDLESLDLPTAIRIFDAASPDCVVGSVSRVPSATWPALAATSRILPTMENMRLYIDELGFDDHLSAMLEQRPTFVVPDDEAPEVRDALAVELLNASSISVASRVELVGSLGIRTYIDVDRIADKTELLIGSLRVADVIDDSTESFARIINADRTEQELYMSAAEEFAGYVDEVQLTGQLLSVIAGSPRVSDDIRCAVVERLESYADKASQKTLDELARFAVKRGTTVSLSILHVLARGHVNSEVLLELLSRVQGAAFEDELLGFLVLMAAPYSELSTRGTRPLVPKNPRVEALLMRLQVLGVVSSWSVEKKHPGKWRVFRPSGFSR